MSEGFGNSPAYAGFLQRPGRAIEALGRDDATMRSAGEINGPFHECGLPEFVCPVLGLSSSLKPQMTCGVSIGFYWAPE